MTTDFKVVAILTAEDVKAIRGADASVVFHHTAGSRNGYSGGMGTMELRKQVGKGSYQTEASVVLSLPSYIETYDWAWKGDDVPRVNRYELSCFGMEHTPSQAPHWRTFASIVKAGDEVELRWTRGNTSEWMEEHGVIYDALDIVIYRGSADALKYGKQRTRLVLRILNHVGDAGSWTRMVRTPLELAQRGY